MPSAATILSGLTTIANDWQQLALVWHVWLAALIGALLAGWRPANRAVGAVLIAPVLSVCALAWASGNPFNAAAFAILAIALATITSRPPSERVRIGSSFHLVSGALLVAFGWIYPHFVAADSWVTYTYASPLGLIPCPTLSVLIGLTLILDGLGSTPWCTTLVAAGLAYGAIGVFRLGVVLDYGLLAGTGVLAAAAFLRALRRSTRLQPLSQSCNHR